MPDWRMLEEDFRRVRDPFSHTRADWSYVEGESETWRIAAAKDRNARGSLRQ